MVYRKVTEYGHLRVHYQHQHHFHFNGYFQSEFGLAGSHQFFFFYVPEDIT